MKDLAYYKVFYWKHGRKDFTWDLTEVNATNDRQAKIEATASVSEYLRMTNIDHKISHARLYYDPDGRIVE